MPCSTTSFMGFVFRGKISPFLSRYEKEDSGCFVLDRILYTK